ncbi:TULIP family P47-like protein [Chitinophaga sp. G-6-1-13]|uniref:TULIP family P47-like protein n=1 Tax=Chitinophaga fulva TaxID=2728842 RepID=A0A848GM01_9BACT|nr:TULIP family P47-like protein [Chitinophaga fulva]NML37720.1 TULIP family P47-like protein [Chitinophaga fulva]
MNTFGWDTVYVVTADKINASLLTNKDKLVLQFDTSNNKELPVDATGSFSRWEIVEGGSGAILYMKLGIGNGKVVFTNTGQEYDLAGMALVVAVQLTMLPGKTLTPSQELKFDIRSVGEPGDPPKPGNITPVALHDLDGKLDPAQRALLMVALATVVMQNASQITYVFATVNLVPPGSNNWLTPVRSGYAYMSRANAPGALAILSVTTDRNIAGLPLQVDGQLLAPGYDASFGISRELFLRNVMMPALPAVFGNGATPAYFVYNNAGGCAQNTQTIAMNGVKSGAIWYYPVLSSFKLTTTGDGLASQYEGSCDLKAGMSMRFWIDPKNRAIYNNTSKILDFLPDPNPSYRKEVHIPWYWWFLGLIPRAIIELIVQAIGSSIAKSLTADAGKYLTLTRKPPTSVQWTGTERLDVQTASLNMGFYMQGNLL